MKTFTSQWLRGFADLIDEAPDSHELNMKFVNLSIEMAASTAKFQNQTIFNNRLGVDYPKPAEIDSIKEVREQIHPPLQIEIDLRDKLDEGEEAETFDEVFRKTNFEAAEEGYKFIKGSTNKKAGVYYLYCKYRFKAPQDSQLSQEDGKFKKKLQGILQLQTAFKWTFPTYRTQLVPYPPRNR